MITVEVLIGVSGSGKSTYINEKIESNEEKTLVFSSDEYRKNMYGSLVAGNTKEANNEVFKKLYMDMKEEIIKENKEDVYIIQDSMNLSRRKRRAKYTEWKKLGVDKVIVTVFFTDLDELNLRQEKRDKENKDAFVNMGLVSNMYKSLQVPRLEVDCDEIKFYGQKWFEDFEVKDINVVKDIEKYVVNERVKKDIMKNYNTHHCRPYHYETINEHIEMTISNAKKSNKDELIECAVFHDLGKGITKRFDEDSWEKILLYKEKDIEMETEEFENIKASYKNHALVGAYLYLNYMYSTNKQGKFNWDVLEMIYQHMNAHQGLGKKNIRNNNLDETLITQIMEFSGIDDISRILK